MALLEDVSDDALREALEGVTGKKPTQRLLAAIAYSNGVTQTELAEWLGVERKTIYNWLTRVETGEIEDGLRDRDRPGRPPKLDSEQRAELRETLQQPPPTADCDAAAWTPSLLQEYVRGQFGVTYSIASCRRLLRAAGLRYRPRGAVQVPTAEMPSNSDGEAAVRGFWVSDRSSGVPERARGRRERHTVWKKSE